MSDERPFSAPDLLAQIADAQVGLQENPRGSNTGTDLMKFFTADDLIVDGKTDGYPWCASFVCWCVQEWVRQLSQRRIVLKEFLSPRTPLAFALPNWAQSNRCRLAPPFMFVPARGDIVVYTWSHCGIVIAASQQQRNFTAVEGNTNGDGSREGYEVARRPRIFSNARVVIRLPNPV